jgi:hypothetical protein
MQSGYQSRIEMNPETGRKCLIVYYDSDSDDFDEAIKQAVAFHSIKQGQMNVIALPRGFEGGKCFPYLPNTHAHKK